MPPTTTSPTRTYPAGVPCWVDTEQPDLDAALAFYGGLFGWDLADVAPPGRPRYVVASLGGRSVAGLGPAPSGPAAWSTYVAVDDATAATARLVELGATVTAPPSDVGEAGRSASLVDPVGAEVRLWQAGRRGGAQVVNEAGTWGFSDLHTGDAATARGFYEPAFGWEVDDLGFATLVRRPGYGDYLVATVDPDLRRRQEDVAAPPGFEDAVAWMAPLAAGEAPQWHVSFNVLDRDAAVATAEELGAEVLAHEVTQWTRTAASATPRVPSSP